MEDVKKVSWLLPVTFMVVLVGMLVKVWMDFRWKQRKDQKKGREEGEEVEDVVRLYLYPEADEATLPSLTNHTAVPMRGKNILPAFVNGHHCEIFVDCGTSSAIMTYRCAKYMGLLSQVTGTKLILLRMWSRNTVAKMMVVEAVTVELAGGVSFPCTFLVAPKDGPINHLKVDIFLDNATLRRTRAVQWLKPFSTTLYFPNPMPQWQPRTSPDFQLEVDNARFGKCVRNDRLKVLVDTGARVFYASRKYHHPNTSVEVVVAKDSIIVWRPLEFMPTTTFDFVLGTHLLAKYCSILDYANLYLYFYIDDRVYRARLRRTSAL